VIGLVVLAMLVFTRIAGTMMMMPVLNAKAVPPWARLLLALPITFLVLPAAVSPEVPATVSGLVLAVMGEALLGLTIGFVVSVSYSALAIGAELISNHAGLEMASMLDPLTDSQPGALGGIATWLGTGVFLGTGMHERLLCAVADSLTLLPPGALVHPAGMAVAVLQATTTAFATGVRLAGPLAAFAFTTNLGLSLLGRMAPNLQIFYAIGPTLTVIGGIIVLISSLPVLLGTWLQGLPAAMEQIGQLVTSVR
jgi:flagellar biosynthetic protein FliR